MKDFELTVPDLYQDNTIHFVIILSLEVREFCLSKAIEHMW